MPCSLQWTLRHTIAETVAGVNVSKNKAPHGTLQRIEPGEIESI